MIFFSSCPAQSPTFVEIKTKCGTDEPREFINLSDCHKLVSHNPDQFIAIDKNGKSFELAETTETLAKLNVIA